MGNVPCKIIKVKIFLQRIAQNAKCRILALVKYVVHFLVQNVLIQFTQILLPCAGQLHQDITVGLSICYMSLCL